MPNPPHHARKIKPCPPDLNASEETIAYAEELMRRRYPVEVQLIAYRDACLIAALEKGN